MRGEFPKRRTAKLAVSGMTAEKREGNSQNTELDVLGLQLKAGQNLPESTLSLPKGLKDLEGLVFHGVPA